MFKPVSNKVDFSALEAEVLRFWEEKDIFIRSVAERPEDKLFVLYEGPPTANASPGIHHVLARVFKDVIPRYKTMKGYRAPRKGGWDTHGLPVELEVEKELGIKSKPEIESYGVARFNQRCRESVMRYVREWEDLTRRIAFWVDMEHPYRTYDNDYIESGWWIIRQLWDKGLIYQGFRTTPHCPRCGTSLSSHEVALGYKDDIPDPSVYVKFRLTGYDAERRTQHAFPDPFGRLLRHGEPVYFLAWTTTPWTLPGNTALAVAPGEAYVLVKTRSAGGAEERVIMASKKALLDQALGLGNWEILEELPGSELVALAYEPLYDPDAAHLPLERVGRLLEDGTLVSRQSGSGTDARRWPIAAEHRKNSWQVYPADFVTLAEGTGIVHIAPAFGEDDCNLGRQKGLLHVQPVELDGKFVGDYPFSGRFVKEADPLILQDLKERGLLHRQETIRHTYPFCWRCDSPLLYYAKSSWYIRTTVAKDRLIGGNQGINWYPEHIKEGRFGDWLRNNVDWAVSRERYWGTPLPIWKCQGCGKEVCIGSIEELRQMAHYDEMAKAGYTLEECLKDLHRPNVDNIILKCPGQPGSTHYPDTMRRVPEVMDCWFDSGAMPFAQWHYPFQNREEFQRSFPADYICEAVDQTRGWFYTLHALSTLLFDRPCYKNVICLGHILDDKGEKMSKSRGNVVQPWAVIQKYGADALRWYLYTASPAGNPRRFSAELVSGTVRKFLLPLWNTYSFFVTYANIDKFDPRSAPQTQPQSDLDRWILSELNLLISRVEGSLEAYDPTAAARGIEAFVDGLSNWYVRRSRRRFWKSENDADKLSAHATLYRCLTVLTHLLAPFTPFLAETMYQNLVRTVDTGAPESVHLDFFPVAEPSQVDEELNQATRLAMKLSSLGRAARSKAGIKVRQPLAQALVRVREQEEEAALQNLAAQLLDEINVKEVSRLEDESQVMEYEIRPNLAILGPKYGGELASVKDALEGLAVMERLKPGYVALTLRQEGEIETEGYRFSAEELMVEGRDRAGFTLAREGEYLVAISTEITPELKAEGLAREVVHRLQTMRKEAGFDIADYIVTYFGGDEAVRRVMKQFAGYIQQETLSRQLVELPQDVHTLNIIKQSPKAPLSKWEGEPYPDTYFQLYSIEGQRVSLAVRRATRSAPGQT